MCIWTWMWRSDSRDAAHFVAASLSLTHTAAVPLNELDIIGRSTWLRCTPLFGAYECATYPPCPALLPGPALPVLPSGMESR